MTVTTLSPHHAATGNTVLEEISHVITHGLGFAVAIVGLVMMALLMPENSSPRLWWSTMIFCSSAILLYGASTAYHSIPMPKLARTRHWLQKCDHAAIYLLIAGSYTPFAAVTLQEHSGGTLLAVIWGLGMAGMLWKLINSHRFEKLSLWLYLGMGWMGVLAMKPLYQELSGGGIALLLGGGAAYSVGAIFYAWNRLPFNHAIWHLFVLAGTSLHYFAVLFFVVPVRG